MLDAGQVVEFDLRKLKYERLSRNITGARMGEILGVSSNAYYKKERGDSSITIREYCLMLTAMQIHPLEAVSLFSIGQYGDKKDGELL